MMSCGSFSARYLSLLLTFGTLGAGCSAVVDAGRVQCTTDADCTKRGESFASSTCVESFCQVADAWSCAVHAPLVDKSSKKFSVDFNLFDAVSMKPAAGIDASLCGKLDIECSLPTGTMKTEADGVVRFDVSSAFDGYVQLNAEGYDPTMIFLPPVTEALSLGQFPLTTMVATAVLGGQLGKPLLPNTGRVLVTTTGCDKQTASGVTLSGENMGDDAAVFYAVGGFPSFTASETDSSGFAGFVNVLPGSVTLSAALSDGRKIGRVALFVRANYVSVRRLQPWTD
jgi:hypothetical protein